MTHNLDGKRIALLEARLGGELVRLVERYGGQATSFPALREKSIDASKEVSTLIDDLGAGRFDIIVFQTGTGASSLLSEADKIGRMTELLDAIRRVKIAARGPKPAAVLARHGLKPDVTVHNPYTTRELIDALASFDLAGKGIAVLHYGEHNLALTQALIERGAHLTELCLYKWEMPEDITPLKNLIQEIRQNTFDAVAFTSQIQARHLFQIAEHIGQKTELTDSLNRGIVVASIGPTCSAALRSLGVEPDVEPEHPKMGPLVMAMADYLVNDQRALKHRFE